MTRQRRREAAPCRHLVLDLGYEGSHISVVQAFGNNVEALHQGNARFHHGRHLAGKNGDVRRLNFLGAQREQRLRFSFQALGIDPLLSKLRLRQSFAGSDDFALAFSAIAIDAAPDECAISCHAFLAPQKVSPLKG